MDMIIGNPDRHPGNWIRRADGGLVAIDQGEAFGYDLFIGNASEFSRDRFMRINSDGDDEWCTKIDYAPQDIDLIRKRLEALKPSFIEAGRLAWYNRMIYRLAAIRKRANGTRSILPA
jgi:hypothetical protein